MGINLTKLSDIASIRHGYAFEGEFFSTDEKEHILLTPGNFHVDQKLYFGTNTKFYDGPIPEDYVLDNGDLLVVMTDLTKDMAILGNAVVLESPKPVLHNQRIGKIEYHQDKVDKNFLCFVLNSPFVRNKVKATASGTTVRHTSPSKILEVSVWFPPLPEQQKIAKILSTWDKAITTTEKLIATSQQQKKALMQQLLTGKKRLVNPETGQVFEGDWKVYKFASLFKERVEVGRADLPLLSITADDGVVYQEETGRKNTSNDDKSKYRRICKDDIGYNTMRMWQGRSSLSDKEGIVSPAYTIVIPNEKVVPSFASYLFKLPEMVHVFYRNSQGLVSDTWNLKFTHFKKITWAFPTVKEQNSIALVLTSTDKEIGLLHAKLAHLKNEKKALMQQLLTGKRRVKIDATEVA